MGLSSVTFVVNAFTNAFAVFIRMITATELMPFYFTMLAVLMVITYFFGSLVIPAGSDSVKGSGNTSGGNAGSDRAKKSDLPNNE